MQKQASRSVLMKRSSENLQQICREHSCRSVISIKLQSNVIDITLRHGCSPVNLLHIFRTPFYKSTYGGLLLLMNSLQLQHLQTMTPPQDRT